MYITYLHVSYSEGQSKSMYICYDTYIEGWRKGGSQPTQESYHTKHGYTEEGEGKKRKRKKTKISKLKSQISNLAYSRLFTE